MIAMRGELVAAKAGRADDSASPPAATPAPSAPVRFMKSRRENPPSDDRSRHSSTLIPSAEAARCSPAISAALS